mgnify:CR=1 FL=1
MKLRKLVNPLGVRTNAYCFLGNFFFFFGFGSPTTIHAGKAGILRGQHPQPTASALNFESQRRHVCRLGGLSVVLQPRHHEERRHKRVDGDPSKLQTCEVQTL